MLWDIAHDPNLPGFVKEMAGSAILVLDKVPNL